MKEITFDELIKKKYAGSNMMLFSKDTLIKFMQQVREATIEECVEILRNPNIPKSRMESLPTDRIKTEKITKENRLL